MPAKKSEKQDFNLELFVRVRRNFVYAIGLILFSAGMIVFAIIPQFKQAWELRGKAELEKPKLEKLNQKLAAIENIRFSPEFSQADFVNQALPSKKPLLELMVSLNSISIASGVTIERFELNPGMIATDAATARANQRNLKNQGDVDTLDIKMSVVGSDEAVEKFISQIEEIAPFTTVTRMTLSSLLNQEGAEFTSSNNDRRAELATSTFFFAKPIVATIDNPLPTVSTNEQVVLNSLAKLVPSELPEQTSISGGGLEDLFGVDPLLFE